MSRTKPIIGITLDYIADNSKYNYSVRPSYALRADYSDVVNNLGGIAMLIPCRQTQMIPEILASIDALIIPGGDEDINPKFYGRDVTYDKLKTNDMRAEFELEIAKKALSMNMPFLGICNGMQVLNTVCGGTLIQHIPDYHNSDVNHEQPHPKNVPSHAINIVSDSKIHKLAGTDRVMVNSTHHQAIDNPGKNLVVTAKADDGIIEAVESTAHRFALGVEWHPEYQNSDLDCNLFKELIEKAAQFKFMKKP